MILTDLDIVLPRLCYFHAMTHENFPRFAGGWTFRFLIDDDHLVDVTGQPTLLEGGTGADVEVEVDLYLHQERLFCGAVRVTTAPHRDPQFDDTLGPNAAGAHIDSALWRRLPIGSMIDTAVQAQQETIHALLHTDPRPWMESLRAAAPPRGRPGPRPSLTPELLATVVAPAFKSVTRKPVEAVRAALEINGYAGSAADGSVTIDQARKAVTKARSMGLIPPAKRRTT